MYSQNNEEQLAVDFFEQFPPASGRGRFLDIGAHDGRTFSNSLRLAELGWSGVCVEPSPIPLARLVDEHRQHSGIEVVQAAVTAYDPPQFMPWYDSHGDGYSSLDEASTHRWKNVVQFRKFWVWTLPVQALFGRFGYDFHYLTLDVEKLNLPIFEAMPWAEMKMLRMICVEHDGQHTRMRDAIQSHGFRFHAVNGENLILIRQ